MTGKVVDKTGWNYTIIENDIVETELLDIYEKMLYIALKRFANIQTGEAFPGVKKISKMAGMSERKARSVINSLVEKKFIKVDHRLNKTSVYTLLPTPAQHAGHAPYAGGHAHGAGGVVHTVQEGHAHGADELKKDELKKDELKKDELKKENNNMSDSTNQTPVSEIPYESIINHLNEVCGTNFRKGTEKTRSLIRSRWNEGFRLEDFKTVINKKSTQPHMQKYLRPETLFGTKFEGYLNEFIATNKQSIPVNNHPKGIDW